MVNGEFHSAYKNIIAMFLQLNHQKLDAYKHSLNFTVECYRFSKTLPADERFNLIQQIRRAATSVHLNIAEGCSRKSLPERKRYFEISRGSVIEIDAVLDISQALEYCTAVSIAPLRASMVACFKSLTGLINAGAKDQSVTD